MFPRFGSDSIESSAVRRPLGGDHARPFERLQERATFEPPPEDDLWVARPAFVPDEHPDTVDATRDAPDPAPDEHDGSGVGKALAELTRYAGERVQLSAGLVPETEPYPDTVGVRLLERVGTLRTRAASRSSPRTSGGPPSGAAATRHRLRRPPA